MPKSVTILPTDHIIIVDGTPLHFSFAAPQGLSALKWKNGKGSLESASAPKAQLAGDADYESHIAPYVVLWNAEKARLQAGNALFSA